MSTLLRPRDGLTISVLNDLSELEGLRREWEQLLARSAGQHPSLTPTWLFTWWRVFGGGERHLHTLVVRDRRELVGVLPLLGRRHWYYRTVPLRRLELVATGEDIADEIMSEYLGPIVATGREEQVTLALVDHLIRDRVSWEELVFSALDGQAPAALKLEAAFRARGLSCESQVTTECPFIPLPKRWDDYLAALPSDNRYMARRSIRDFERWAGKDFKVEVARSQEDLLRGKAILHELHEHRWQAAGREGVFVSPRFRRFHDIVMPDLLERGQLDLRWLTVDDRPVAVSYSVINENRLYFYQGGRMMDLPKGVRPGIVLHLYAIKAAIEAGREAYDFLGGEARYKRDLATATRPLLELRVARRSLPEVARGAMQRGRKLLVKARDKGRVWRGQVEEEMKRRGVSIPWMKKGDGETKAE